MVIGEGEGYLQEFEDAHLLKLIFIFGNTHNMEELLELECKLNCFYDVFYDDEVNEISML